MGRDSRCLLGIATLALPPDTQVSSVVCGKPKTAPTLDYPHYYQAILLRHFILNRPYGFAALGDMPLCGLVRMDRRFDLPSDLCAAVKTSWTMVLAIL